MKNFLNRYFADELTSDEKRNFLQEVDNSEELKEEFIENQNLVVLLDWTFPENENDEEVAQQKLKEFMRKMEQRKTK
ncbi:MULTISPECIES: anti-sigma factor [Bacteroides]|jgi:nanoRNase/pAp phosphatase (c-di-AMP/oligoRNAs hydrolase)|uniref:anti-sigma factor n=1 Tax=Bacteroides TaxID=816 RepID=UPI000E510B4D|nr:MULTISPECIES: anti-sigma factor [Bacteroides]QNL41053.1 anti-sigma factor [Bacteroides sp. M10]RGQ94137.1 anti-sigma factor [Bacteroides sp. AF26-7BH]RGY33428.1 anti-sigma factor [Bacteroides sp. OF02-3LB]